jgi:DNA mismatch repair protein MutH
VAALDDADAAGFDYLTAGPEAIQDRAVLLEGRRLGEIPGVHFVGGEPRRGKGEVGLAIERFFGIPPNSIAGADFIGAGIELKVVPLVPGSVTRVKERTVLSMIDYGSLVLETWATARVRKKLRIMFVFFEHSAALAKEDWVVRKTVFWTPSGLVEDLLKEDWYAVKRKVTAGLAHELSESDGRLMGPCTKGVDSSRRVPQPVTKISPTAKPRAFALKPAFTRSIYEEATGSLGATQSLVASLRVRRLDRFEEAILERFSQFEGRTIDDVADELQVPRSASKSYAANVIRRAMGASEVGSPIEEFERSGLTLRTVRVSSDGQPYEATSFPAFRYSELVEETWDDSQLLALVEYMLLVPLLGGTRDTPQGRCRLGRPLFWRPSRGEMEIMKREWQLFQRMVAEGRANSLPGASDTQIIHVRPHARDGRDTDIAPHIGPLIKKSFWLNKRFVAILLRRAG